jgi:hypothetical protein
LGYKLQAMLPPIETVIRQVIRDLKKPAGESADFSSFENILKNRRVFVERCHETWKRLHHESLQRLFFFEGWLGREKTNPMGNAAKEYAEYHRAVIRRINDSIVWSVFGLRRHVVKRLCLYKKRPALLESNPDSVYATLRAFNTQPMSLALWNDATSCVDIGDLTFIKNGMRPVPEFIELKSGEVNAEIIELLTLSGEEHSRKFEEFRAKRAKAGVAQYERVMRQHRTGEQALDLLANDRGTDPVTGLELNVVDIDVAQGSYDSELNPVLLKAIANHSEECELVGGCIWAYANADSNIRREEATLRFTDLLCSRVPDEHQRFLRKPNAKDRDRVAPLVWGLHHPISVPLFLRNLDIDATAATLCGDLRFKVMLYIDWHRFATLCKDSGALFSFVGGKPVRRARSVQANARPPLISGRLAQLTVEDVQNTVTDPALVRMLFDGITPQTVIKTMIAHCEVTMREAGHDSAEGRK